MEEYIHAQKLPINYIDGMERIAIRSIALRHFWPLHYPFLD